MINVGRRIPGVATLALAVALLAPFAHAELTPPRPSPNASVTQGVGLTNLSMTYSRPGVKARKIWGELVPMDKPWRTGANEATTFTTSTDIQVAGKTLPAGTYSFFTIPSKDSWTVIFSKQKELWGAYEYDDKQDQLRVTAKPVTGQPNQEWMWLGFDNLTPTSCDLVLRWETLSLALPITVEVNERFLSLARTEIAAAKTDDWRTPFVAARYSFDNNLALVEGKQWLDKSVAIQATHANLALHARWLAKDGNTKDAIATAKKAVELGKAAKPPADVAPTEKLIAEWSATK
ncbi:MAG: DUF2911 domain-containing protein [Candidatus Eisenbacteria bacterium]|uniref:DUF2911 domain-containing protein n=1 Tax=Eiseniibacteriota bacterium TaxID=2212470 RepID=A0A849SK03_UNCEI|nr:DUF2911 domain-containing protein [Candidatus Eisenbacteria bacterium]